ncbi:4'-phosphopantetheinyl transferase family protein [Spirochaeta isovalerica]|uniref:4'-phosphopantetheinyl transferase n=1 Tax=Spirochaeta isovalerica TaxID=150 RepID=A0A841RGJ3_9SPIO|nr:4'-phosphopantetheinyl transferase superfamily protein [Spirochaeta isovalerica]MBB6481452.1 4'-phosphopantetheinyl transferase [Spirochaeta isovalerica]
MKLPFQYEIPPIGENEIHLWSFPVSPLESHGEENIAILSRRERDKADRFYKKTDRIRSRVVYVLLREILSLYTGTRPGSIEILLRDNGKPYMNQREAPFFNLSHSGDRILYGFNSKGEIGVDIEQIKKNRDLDGLIESCCSAGEIKTMDGLSEEGKTELFYKYWSAKEAYLKGVGTGITVPLKEIDCSAGQQIGSWSVQPCSRWDGYSAAAAIKVPNPRIIHITRD